MIELKQLAEELEKSLNNGLTGGIEFKIFADTGTFKKSYRVKNTEKTVINAIYSNSASDISNVYTDAGGYIVATMTNEAVFVIPCKDEDEDEYEIINEVDESGKITKNEKLLELGNNNFLSQIRKILDNIAAQVINFSLTDSAGNSFDISAVFTLADTGMRGQLPELGDCFTYSLTCAYNIVQYGDNSRQWKIYIDGEAVPYSSMSIQRQTTNETTVYANRGRSTSTLTVADTFAVALEVPSILQGFNSVIKDFLLNGSNAYAHVAKIIANNSTVYKLVVLSDSTATASGVLNVGTKIQINETNEEYGIIAFSSKYKIYRATANSGNITVTTNGELVILYNASGYTFYNVSGSITITGGVKTGDLLIVLNATTFSTSGGSWENIQ